MYAFFVVWCICVLVFCVCMLHVYIAVLYLCIVSMYVHGCTLAITVLYVVSVIGKEERLWPIVKLIIINHHQS